MTRREREIVVHSLRRWADIEQSDGNDIAARMVRQIAERLSGLEGGVPEERTDAAEVRPIYREHNREPRKQGPLMTDPALIDRWRNVRLA